MRIRIAILMIIVSTTLVSAIAAPREAAEGMGALVGLAAMVAVLVASRGANGREHVHTGDPTPRADR